MKALGVKTNVPPTMEAAKEFEGLVARLLLVAGYEVFNEHLIGHKKVDLYFEERRFNSIRRVAVECKAHATPLPKRSLTELYADYLPLYTSNAIDELLIVTKAGLTPSALALIKSTRDLLHLTLAELEGSLLDFQLYLSSLLRQFSEDGLASYYVPLRSTSDLDLEEFLLNWLAIPGDQPLAILGSYGMGKTTFARRMCYCLAKEALAKPNARIPIFLKLAEISSEQSLEGFIGKTLTTTFAVRNYNFDTFMALNQAGRFTIFLDGFDEMKHTLSWDQFRFNFAQLNRLICPNAKVVLLGRPNAFLNEDEHDFALHGIQHIGHRVLRDPNWPDYREIQLALLSREQVTQFLTHYIAYQNSKQTRIPKTKPTSQRTEGLIQQISGKQFSDIARRPVQLRMLAEVLPQWDGDLARMTVALLYDSFIDLVIQRDIDKHSFQTFGLRARRHFAMQIAWLLWRTRQGTGILASDVPDTIWALFSPDNRNLEAIKRDLVSACFLSTKQGGYLYFPHKSFQEFFVSEIFTQQFSSSLDIAILDSSLTDEVAGFLSELLGVSQLIKGANALISFRGILRLKTILLWTNHDQVHLNILSRLNSCSSPWWLILLCVEVIERRPFASSPQELLEIGLEKMETSSDPDYILTCQFCVFISLPRIKVDRREQLFSKSIQALLNSLDTRSRQKDLPSTGKKVIREFLRRFTLSKRSNVVGVHGTYHFMTERLSKYACIREWIIGETLKTDSLTLVSSCEADVYTVQRLRDTNKIDRHPEQH